MKADDNRSLVARHLLGVLRPAETDKLMQRALNDQALFDELLAVEKMRGAFEDPAFREQIAADLRARAPEQRSWTEKLWRGWPRAAWMTAVVAAAAIVIAVIVMRPGQSPGFQNLKIELADGQARESEAELSRPQPQEPPKLEPPPGASSLPLNEASLAFDRQGEVPVYRRGDAMRIGFQLAQDAAVVVVEERPDGSTVRLFPNRYQSSANVAASTLVLIPPAGQGPLAVEGAAGTHTVRAIVFPSGTNPLDFQSWEQIREKARILTRRYRVVE